MVTWLQNNRPTVVATLVFKYTAVTLRTKFLVFKVQALAFFHAILFQAKLTRFHIHIYYYWLMILVALNLLQQYLYLCHSLKKANPYTHFVLAIDLLIVSPLLLKLSSVFAFNLVFSDTFCKFYAKIIMFLIFIDRML